MSTFEKSHIVNDVLNKNEILKKLIINLTKELTNKDPRGWPQLLLLAETLDASRTVFDNLKLIQELSIHSYDPETKRWSVLGKQKSCSGSKTGTISVARVQHDTLVFTSAKSSREKMIYNKMPFNISVYNFWTDSWSFPYQDEEEELDVKTKVRPHNLVSFNGSAFTAFKEVFGTKDQDIISLWSVGEAASDNPVYSMTHVSCDKKTRRLTSPVQLFTRENTVNIVDQLSLYSYDPTFNTWHHSQIQGEINSSSWISLQDGRLLQVGGAEDKTDSPSKSCAVYSSLDEEPLKIGDLVRSRIQPSLAEFRGLVFAAGGLTSSNKRKKSYSRSGTSDLADFYGGEMVVEASVEYYVPEVNCWNLLPVQPEITTGAQLSLVRVDKPMRLLDLSFPSSQKGLKRSHCTDE